MTVPAEREALKRGRLTPYGEVCLRTLQALGLLTVLSTVYTIAEAGGPPTPQATLSRDKVLAAFATAHAIGTATAQALKSPTPAATPTITGTEIAHVQQATDGISGDNFPIVLGGLALTGAATLLLWGIKDRLGQRGRGKERTRAERKHDSLFLMDRIHQLSQMREDNHFPFDPLRGLSEGEKNFVDRHAYPLAIDHLSAFLAEGYDLYVPGVARYYYQWETERYGPASMEAVRAVDRKADRALETADEAKNLAREADERSRYAVETAHSARRAVTGLAGILGNHLRDPAHHTHGQTDIVPCGDGRGTPSLDDGRTFEGEYRVEE